MLERVPSLTAYLSLCPATSSSPGLTHTDTGVGEDQNVIPQHHAVPANRPIFDLDELPAGDGSGVLQSSWIEMRTSLPPRHWSRGNLGNRYQVPLLNTPLQEVLQVRVDPLDRVGRQSAIPVTGDLISLSTSFEKLLRSSGPRTSFASPMKRLDPVHQQDLVADRQPFYLGLQACGRRPRSGPMRFP
jgi:hypothetical protein